MDSERESDEDEEDYEVEEHESRAINYVVGDVTHPKNTQDRDAFVVHCVGRYKYGNIIINLNFTNNLFLSVEWMLLNIFR